MVDPDKCSTVTDVYDELMNLWANAKIRRTIRDFSVHFWKARRTDARANVFMLILIK